MYLLLPAAIKMTILQLIKKLIPAKKDSKPSADTEALRLDFKQRYHDFKLLLSANNKALEIMADIEKLTNEGRPFGMSVVRSNCTAVSVNVFRMIRKIDRLAPQMYSPLFDRFNTIQQEINSVLAHTRITRDERLVIPLSEIDMAMSDLVGGKMANLSEMRNKIGLDVPDGFVITSFAYERFFQHNDLQAEIDRRIQMVPPEDIRQLYKSSAEIQQLIIGAQIPADLSDAIGTAVKQLQTGANDKISLALRSSALGEDSADTSFAGQYRSILNVSVDNFFQAYKEVVASKYSLPAITYRLNRGYRDEDIAMCVGCLCMVDAVSGGVAYSHNPFEIQDHSIFINSAWGLPKAVVDGSVSCDLFVVSREPDLKIIYEDIQYKNKQFICGPEEGVCRIELMEDARQLSSLTKEQVIELAKLCIKIESHYGCPQDIEWALSTDEKPVLYVLQCRPLKQKNREGKPYQVTSKASPDTEITKGGVTASPGAAYGKVFITEKNADILQFPPNAVLVTKRATPNWAPLLNRAAAVVTEQGGFAGHLANVAREFEIPALFGMENITQKVKNGEVVTVDADGLAVHKGKVKSLLNNRIKKKNLMEGSPVYEVLKKASRFIVPLNFLDPDANEFRADNCKTFHDITRFIHEKSVYEMFNFGKNHNFSEKSSKQLYFHVPMKWWILNLDDGFKEEVPGKYVRLENIASIPMLALWEGIIAIPWDGPPPVDGKGMASIMFQATANTALNTGVRSRYSERNYFMISKNYCNLSSRLGFHFSTLEALLSDRISENYISFRFKGGAADHLRRLKRVQFVGELLTDYGFETEIKEDNMTARLEGYETEFMSERLKIIGYLTIHTRQLDMIMSKPAVVAHYLNKFKKDIDSILKNA